jgi:hypothetical protein
MNLCVIATVTAAAALIAAPATMVTAGPAYADCGDPNQPPCTGPVPTIDQVVAVMAELTDPNKPAATQSPNRVKSTSSLTAFDQASAVSQLTWHTSLISSSQAGAPAFVPTSIIRLMRWLSPVRMQTSRWSSLLCPRKPFSSL